MSLSLRSRWLKVISVCLFVSSALALAACGDIAALESSGLASTATNVSTPVPSPTPRPTETPTPMPTAMPSPTPTPTHPLMVEVMRQQDYPGSEIVIESQLEPGSNYDRYIASYLSEGLKIYALLTAPRGERPENGWPVIVFNHGYIPPDEYRTTERYVAYVDNLARNGYIVFRPDYRGHGDSEGEATGAYGSPDYTIDVLNAVASLRMYPDADPERMGMWGHSMGGSIALRSMIVVDDIRVGVIWAGMVAPYPDIFERWERRRAERPTPTPGGSSTRGRWRTELLETYGTFEENPAFWASIDPTYYLGDLSGPLQLHHGTGDDSVPVEFSEGLYEQLTTMGQVVELYLYENDDHNIANYFGSAMQRTVQFFDLYLKGTD